MSLLDEIKALPAALRSARDTQAIADALPARISRKFTEIGNGAVLAIIGLASGNALLDVVGAEPNFRHVKPLLDQGRLDVSSDLVRASLDALVGGCITQAEADAIKALAETATPVSEFDVRVACYADNGDWLA